MAILDLPSHLASKAIDITNIGSNELAWSREDALHVLELFAEHLTVVLGGDVLELQAGKYKYTYDNWHFDPSSVNSPATNSKNSIQLAKTYIQGYREGPFVFVLVTPPYVWRFTTPR
jgi:hypothetical protein